jgi:hypothetical protein
VPALTATRGAGGPAAAAGPRSRHQPPSIPGHGDALRRSRTRGRRDVTGRRVGAFGANPVSLLQNPASACTAVRAGCPRGGLQPRMSAAASPGADAQCHRDRTRAEALVVRALGVFEPPGPDPPQGPACRMAAPAHPSFAPWRCSAGGRDSGFCVPAPLRPPRMAGERGGTRPARPPRALDRHRARRGQGLACGRRAACRADGRIARLQGTRRMQHGTQHSMRHAVAGRNAPPAGKRDHVCHRGHAYLNSAPYLSGRPSRQGW